MDWAATSIGSWPFLIVQPAAILAWVGAHIVSLLHHWDPSLPAHLLNLLFSVQAAYIGPVLRLAGAGPEGPPEPRECRPGGR